MVIARHKHTATNLRLKCYLNDFSAAFRNGSSCVVLCSWSVLYAPRAKKLAQKNCTLKAVATIKTLIKYVLANKIPNLIDG